MIYVFFPIFVNTLKGLRQIEPVHAELMRSYAASPVDHDADRAPARRAAVLLHGPEDRVAPAR